MRTKSHSQKKEKRAYNRTFYVGLVPELYFILSKLCILQTAVNKIENLGTCLQNEYKHSDPADGGTTFFHVAVKIKFLVVALIKDSLYNIFEAGTFKPNLYIFLQDLAGASSIKTLSARCGVTPTRPLTR